MRDTRALFFAVAFIVLLLIGCKTMDHGSSSLPITIAPEYEVTNTSTESISSPIPDQKPTTQVFVEVTKNSKKAYIFYWDGLTIRDLGPMAEKESWKHNFLGEEGRVIRTTLFMGKEQEVLVLHYKPDKNTQLMIYSKEMDKNEFHEMLDRMRKK